MEEEGGRLCCWPIGKKDEEEKETILWVDWTYSFLTNLANTLYQQIVAEEKGVVFNIASVDRSLPNLANALPIEEKK